MKRLLSAILLALLPAAAVAAEPDNPLYDELLNKGIPLPDGPTVKLVAPLIKPGQGPAVKAALLDKAAGNRPVELFIRRSVTAPFSLQINSVEKADKERRAQLIDLAFIAYGKLEAVLETDLHKMLLAGKEKPGGANEATTLTAADLAGRRIRLLTAPNLKEQYGTISMPLLEKVRIEGLMRTVRTNSPNFILSATRMDDRFKNDKEYPNVWRRIIPTAGGEKLGPPHPYAGMAGYVVVTKLTEPKDALLVEMHYVLPEPPDWFEGRNLLRSKLPVVIQDNVRSFRRKLTRD